MKCIKCAREKPADYKFCPYCGKPQVPAKKHRKRPNGAGSIVKLSGNRSKPWAAKKAGVLVGTFSTRGEAAKALERITDATINDRYNWTFTQVYEAWKPGHDLTVGDDGKKSTVTAYNACAELHDLKFRSLRKSDFQTVLDRLTVEGKSKSTCEKMLQLFGAMSECYTRGYYAHKLCKILQNIRKTARRGESHTLGIHPENPQRKSQGIQNRHDYHCVRMSPLRPVPGKDRGL